MFELGALVPCQRLALGQICMSVSSRASILTPQFAQTPMSAPMPVLAQHGIM